ncbi:MAG: RpoL/Rpb11 RNA polymerase subunit family protein [Candidatus Micrarchaeota archaeon]
MEIEILKKEKKHLELRVSDVDQIILRLLVDKLNANKNVEFAACKIEHPTSGIQRMIVKTKKDEPMDLVLEALEETTKEVKEFASNFKKK